jgi:acyl-CoA thioesterase I
MKNTIHHLFWHSARLGLVLAFCISSRSGLADDSSIQTSTESRSLPVRLACVGDSITYGYGLTNRAHNSYPADLGRWLGAGWDVRNFGVNATTLLKKGDLPYFKQKAHAEALEFKPDIVVIMLGTNDSKHREDGSLEAAHAINNWQYRSDYVPDYEALIAEFRQANPAVKVYVCLPTPCFPGRWGINNKTIHDEIIPMIRQVAEETHATIIDLYTALLGKGDLFPDTVHPNKAGARLMAAAIYRALTGKAPPAPAAWAAPQREKLKARTVKSLRAGIGVGFNNSTL